MISTNKMYLLISEGKQSGCWLKPYIYSNGQIREQHRSSHVTKQEHENAYFPKFYYCFKRVISPIMRCLYEIKDVPICIISKQALRFKCVSDLNHCVDTYKQPISKLFFKKLQNENEGNRAFIWCLEVKYSQKI